MCVYHISLLLAITNDVQIKRRSFIKCNQSKVRVRNAIFSKTKTHFMYTYFVLFEKYT